MLIKLTKVGRYGDRNEIHPSYRDLDSVLQIAFSGEMIFEQDPSSIFISAERIQQAVRVKIPVYEWIPKYANEEEMKRAIPWWKRIFAEPMNDGRYQVVKVVECTKVITAFGATYLVEETPEQIIEIQAKYFNK